MFSIRTAKDDDHRTALHAASDLGLVSNQVLNLGQLIVSSAWSYGRSGDVRRHKRVSCGFKRQGIRAALHVCNSPKLQPR